MPGTARKTAKRASKARKAASGRSGSAVAGKKLVIVESPAKARTINRYLGPDYSVKASMGHVRDLPKKNMGVDIEHGFEPTYQPLDGRKKLLAELKRQAKAATEVFLATDLDREGEAIAWHLAECLDIKADKLRRAVFNEITGPAIREAFARPRQIDMDKVDAQQARRILDRIVGYEISPLLWRKVSPGLSAGRVQSVAVRLIVDREREIGRFCPQEYWKISAVFSPDLAGAEELARSWAELLRTKDAKGNPPTRKAQQEFLADHGAFRAELVEWDAAKFQPEAAEQAVRAAEELGFVVRELVRSEDAQARGAARHRVAAVGEIGPAGPEFRIANLSRRQARTNPPAPFTTASLQQAAAVQLRFSAARTMRLAQQLYEGVDIPGEGSVGLITYMRTDSRHVSAQALAQVRELISESFGGDYLPQRPRVYSSSARAQEAHETIRPVDVRRRPEDVRSALDPAQHKLYRLIWQRFVACQMAPAVWQVTSADVVAETAGGHKATFKAIGRTLQFDGFLRVAGRPAGGEQILPALDEGQQVAPADLTPTQHFTQPPPRYTEASLVKALEAEGIGRPSTYAGIIQTIQDRGYVEQLHRAFRPTDLGTVVTDKLVSHFPKVMDVRFTAHMEDQLDLIEEAKANRVAVLAEFYGPFSENLRRAREEMVHAKAEQQPSQYVCDNCGKPMVYRFSRNGRYLACTGYPECKTTYPVDREGRKVEALVVDVACPQCGREMVKRTGKYGPFLSCSAYPDCKGLVNLDRKGLVKLPTVPPLEVDLPCPKCGSRLYLRRSKRGPWLSCSKYPKCRGRAGWKTLSEDQRKQLELQLLNHEKQHPLPTIRTCGGKPITAGHEPQPLERAAEHPEPEAD